MRFFLILLNVIGLIFNTLSQNVGINSTGAIPDISAILDVAATDKGVLIPRMTTSQRNALSSPAIGLLIYNLDTKCVQQYDGTTWKSLCGNAGVFTIVNPPNTSRTYSNCYSSCNANWGNSVLNYGNGLTPQAGWSTSALDGSNFSTVDLGSIMTNIVGLIFQKEGGAEDQYATCGIVQYSTDNVTWSNADLGAILQFIPYVYSDSRAKDSYHITRFNSTITARYIRIIPKGYYGWMAMRYAVLVN